MAIIATYRSSYSAHVLLNSQHLFGLLIVLVPTSRDKLSKGFMGLTNTSSPTSRPDGRCSFVEAASQIWNRRTARQTNYLCSAFMCSTSAERYVTIHRNTGGVCASPKTLRASYQVSNITLYLDSAAAGD